MRFQTLQHKNVITSAVVALGIFLIALTTLHQQGEVSSLQTLVAQTLTTTQTTTDIDADRDGLPDWKERLYGSDINKPDTDGDGTGDGDEIAQKRNPVIRNTAGAGNPPQPQPERRLVPPGLRLHRELHGFAAQRHDPLRRQQPLQDRRHAQPLLRPALRARLRSGPLRGSAVRRSVRAAHPLLFFTCGFIFSTDSRGAS